MSDPFQRQISDAGACHSSSNRLRSDGRSGRATPRRITLFKVVALILLVFVFQAPTWGSWIALSPDSFTFLRSARLLAQQGTFELEQIQCPPGFPILLAPLLMVSDAPWLAIRLIATSAVAATAVLSYLLFRRRLGERGSILVAVVVATSGILLLLSSALLSECVYLALTMVALLCINRMDKLIIEIAPSHGGTLRAAAWAGLWTAGAIMVRSMGIALVAAGLFMLLRRLRIARRQAIIASLVFILPTALSLGIWQVRQSQFPPKVQYSDIVFGARSTEHTDASVLALQWERLRDYTPVRFRALKALIVPEHVGWPIYAPPWHWPTSAAIGALLIIVCIVRLLRKPEAEDVYFMATMAIICTWPFDEGTRMAAPLLPIVWFYIIGAGRAGYQQFQSMGQRTLATVMCGALALAWLAMIAIERAHLQEHSLAVAEQRMYNRIRDGNALAASLEKRVPAAVDILCVTQQGSDSKVTAIAADYYGRRRIRKFRDIESGDTVTLETILNTPSPVLVEKSLLNPRYPVASSTPPSPAAADADFEGPFTLLTPELLEQRRAAN